MTDWPGLRSGSISGAGHGSWEPTVSDAMECSIEGCPNKLKARGWCSGHYKRWRRTGDPLTGGLRTPAQMFWDRVEKTEACWNWTGHVVDHGYGRYNCSRIDLGTYYAHRQVFYFLGMEQPKANQLVDHLCHNKRCVNPEHLRITDETGNHQNLNGPRRDSSSGLRGVTIRNLKDGTPIYRPSATRDGRIIYFGSYRSREQAIAIADTARREDFAVPGRLNSEVVSVGKD